MTLMLEHMRKVLPLVTTINNVLRQTSMQLSKTENTPSNEGKHPSVILAGALVKAGVHVPTDDTMPQDTSMLYPDAVKEIENIGEQWEEGLMSDGEALTKLAYIQGHLSERVNKVILGINEREKNEAEKRLSEIRR